MTHTFPIPLFGAFSYRWHGTLAVVLDVRVVEHRRAVFDRFVAAAWLLGSGVGVSSLL